MVQTRFLFTVAIIVAVISLNCENCNAAIAKIGDRQRPPQLVDLEDIDEFLSEDYVDEEFDNDRFLSDAEDRPPYYNRGWSGTPEKWLKRQVRRLWRALGAIENDVETSKDDITDIASDVEKNKMDIDNNAANITNNEEDISDNKDDITDIASDVEKNKIDIDNNAANITNNEEDISEIEMAMNSTMDMVAENAEAISNNTMKIKENQEMIANNTHDIETNYDLLADGLGLGIRRYLTFGGFDDIGGMVTEHVFLVEVNLLDNTTTSCIHSLLPAQMKESHVYEYNDTLLVCSAFLLDDKKNLQCYIWDDEDMAWEDFATPDINTSEEDEQNGIFNFIASVKIPGVGIWFTSSKQNKADTYEQGMAILHENGSWTGTEWPGRGRNKGCMVLYNDTSVAYIGGNPETLSDSIDTYNFVTETFEDDIAMLPFNLTHNLCALIPVGLNGHPTVVILGDDGRRKEGTGSDEIILENYAHEMILWDTVTNDVTTVEHPPGYDDNTRFFRPAIATWDDNTMILAASEVKVLENGVSTSAILTDQWLYSVADGWTNIGPIDPPQSSEILYDLYVLDNPNLGAYDSLKECPPGGSR